MFMFLYPLHVRSSSAESRGGFGGPSFPDLFQAPQLIGFSNSTYPQEVKGHSASRAQVIYADIEVSFALLLPDLLLSAVRAMILGLFKLIPVVMGPRILV